MQKSKIQREIKRKTCSLVSIKQVKQIALSRISHRSEKFETKPAHPRTHPHSPHNTYPTPHNNTYPIPNNPYTHTHTTTNTPPHTLRAHAYAHNNTYPTVHAHARNMHPKLIYPGHGAKAVIRGVRQVLALQCNNSQYCSDSALWYGRYFRLFSI
jgi:hypothetical protein